ncbi:hypothetical protein [Nocardioides bruguierae]|uniref:Uncharacterized protein n=1 Tax=Nocardioides bruguierae TaxID=2945102 RepID=A0A9X2D9F7_9ACTN|nr:hypothetical protein [Nocardioides bruguierae]MCL8023821.1 hypothetical protein [Nocardioides bruguierae]MCM0621732.1 hypothetical protein [Nocardioides bruguierae]
MIKLLLFVAVVALVTYYVVRTLQKRGVLSQGAQRPGSGSARPRRVRREPPRTVAPDDDPDFLRELDRRRLHGDDPDSP